MVMKMNKAQFIEELEKTIGYSKEDCNTINEILESNFIISKKSKDTIILKLIETLNISQEEAEKIYKVSAKIITTEVKNKLKHPFKSID